MDANRQSALVESERELRVNLSLLSIFPLLEKTQDGRGGFMTREEKMYVEAEKGDPDRVSKIIEILRKKDNDAFDRFCAILKQSGNEVWEKTIREYAERAAVRRSEKHLDGFEGKGGTAGVYINEPQMPDLERHLRKMDHELSTYILQQPEEKYIPLKLSCEGYIGSLKRSNRSEHHCYPLPNDREEMWWEIRHFWNQLDVRFLADIVNDFTVDRKLSILLKEHQDLIAKFSRNTLEQFHKERIGLSDGPHLTVKVKDNPTMKMIFTLQDYLMELGVKECLFKGFTHGCVVLYFLISPTSAKLLPSTLSMYFQKLDSMGILTIAVPGQWEVDITASLGKITKDMAKGRNNPPNREPGLVVKSHTGVGESDHALVPYDKEVAPHYVETKVLQPEDQQSIIAFGVTGHGKSSFLNLLVRTEKPVFETSAGELSGASSKTKETQCVSITMNDRRLALIDTPGFSDTHRIADNRDQEASLLVKKERHKFSVNITKAFVLAGRKVSAFIFVYRVDSRFSLEMTEQLKFLEAINIPWDHCILVMTHGDHVFPDKPKKKWYEALDAKLAVEESVNKQLKGLIQRTAPRLMFVNNTCRDSKYHKVVIERFLGLMKQIADQHGPYDNIHFALFHQEYNREFRSAYMDAIQNASLHSLTAAMESDFEQLTLIGRSLIAKQKEFIKCFQSVIDMVGTKTFSPVIAATTGIAAIAVGGAAITVGASLIPVAFRSGAFFVEVGIQSIVGGIGALAGVPFIKKLKDIGEVKKAQSCLDVTVDVMKRFYPHYKSIMKKISEPHPNAKHSLFARFAAIHIHESADKSEALFETAQELEVFCSLRYQENNPSPQSTSHYTLPIGFSLLASTMDVAQTVGAALSVTHVSQEIDAALLKECEHALQKEFNAIKTLCITE